jgi:hypothetical protein
LVPAHVDLCSFAVLQFCGVVRLCGFAVLQFCVVRLCGCAVLRGVARFCSCAVVRLCGNCGASLCISPQLYNRPEPPGLPAWRVSVVSRPRTQPGEWKLQRVASFRPKSDIRTERDRRDAGVPAGSRRGASCKAEAKHGCMAKGDGGGGGGTGIRHSLRCVQLYLSATSALSLTVTWSWTMEATQDARPRVHSCSS